MESLIPPSNPLPSVVVDTRAYPKAIQDFLAQNRAESERFVSESYARELWLNDHDFRVSADLCIDGRVSDFSEALGLSTGLLEMYRSAGCRYNVPTSWIYSRRIRDGNRKLRVMDLGDSFDKRMIEMRMVTVHYSASRPKDSSCAAWEHRTSEAVTAMQDLADRFNDRYFRGNMIAFVVLVDTDLDAVTVIGPGGRLSTKEYINIGPRRALTDILATHLRQIFPASWSPLLTLEEQYRRTFHEELAEHLASNVAFVEHVRATDRPLELLIHQERMIFVGRPLETRNHNTAFLIEDREDEANRAQFRLGMRYVLQNALTDAIASEDRDWTVPVFISIPNDKDDLEQTVDYARGIRANLEAELEKIKDDLAATVGRKLNGSPDRTLPDWVMKDLQSLERHVSWCTTTNDRRTRLFVPCD